MARTLGLTSPGPTRRPMPTPQMADGALDALDLQRSGRARTRPRLSCPSGFNSRRSTAGRFPLISSSRARPRPSIARAVLINIHGGPEGQYRPLFSGVTQYQVNEMGLAVIYPNVRGSAGYGKTYLQLDNAELREDSVRDIGRSWTGSRPGPSLMPRAWP